MPATRAKAKLWRQPAPSSRSGLRRRRSGGLAARSAREIDRQRNEIELIASENIVSRAVLEAAGSPLTNKYAEGYPGRRYYGGCQFVDEAETLAIERAKQLFDCNFANVQPNSGSQANQAVLAGAGQARRHHPRAVARGRRTPDARRGAQSVGQVVQGAVTTACAATTSASTSTRWPQLAREHRPRIIIAGGSAYPRVIDFARFRAIADEVGAYPDGRHGAFRRPRRRRRASEPAAARPCRDDAPRTRRCAARAAAWC